jgi:DNA (cytosine-5)-methyltransferase 1
LIKLRGTSKVGDSPTKPGPTVTAGGLHIGEVRAFLCKYYGTGGGQDLDEPGHTLTSKHRFGLVTINCIDYVIVDIGMRMLEPHELFALQGFPSDYVIAPLVKGKNGKRVKRLSKTEQVRMVGNSVCPDVAEALVRANFREEPMRKRA